MDETTEKLLLLILGFLLGAMSNILVNVVREVRRKRALCDLIRTEIQAFIQACEWAIKSKIWDSSIVEHLAEHIARGYSEERDRLVAVKDREKRRCLCDFYIEVSTFPSLIRLYRQQLKDGEPVSSMTIGPGNYEGVIKRANQLLRQLK